MRAVTIHEAKAHLNELIDAAERGEQVVLMRGSRHVAALVAISTEEVELAPRLSDAQAERLGQRLAQEKASGRTRVFGSAGAAVRHLTRPSRASRVTRNRGRHRA